MDKINELASAILNTRNEIDELEKLIEELKSLKAKLEEKTIEYMFDNDIEKITVNGHTFYPSTKLYASVKSEWKEAAFDWFKINGFEHVVKEQIHAQTLSSLCREWRDSDNGIPLELTPFISVYDKISINVRKN